ncbi:MAG: hypothetical protein H6592_08490 [Flavobacteriales bacterium]|nr:hypothetical protein [Flavobacteriales bacterium]HPF89069.1 hypothetical protein [Flavobacteriales bacterium]
MNRRIALALLLVAALGTAGQAQMGIHYGVHFEKLTAASSGSNWHMGVGWDFDLNDRLSGGLDVHTDMNWTTVDDYYYGYSTEYGERLKVIGIQYRSQFHFMDNDGTSVYLGPTVGLRAVKQKIEYGVETPSFFGSSTYELVRVEGKGMVFPLGLRLGLRGSMESGYADLFIGVGTYLGSGEPFTTLAILKKESLPNRTFFQVGLNYGFGW